MLSRVRAGGVSEKQVRFVLAVCMRPNLMRLKQGHVSRAIKRLSSIFTVAMDEFVSAIPMAMIQSRGKGNLVAAIR